MVKTEKTKAVATLPSEEALAELRNSYPTEPTMHRVLLPRLGMVSQDVIETVKKDGKKTKQITTEAGTFYIERETDDVNEETNSKVWARTEIGTALNGIILYQRKQLKYYDEKTEKYTSSPVYDEETEIIPLFCDRQEIARGTPAELKAKYPGVSKTTGKKISLLEENRVLYVLITDQAIIGEEKEGEIFQLNLRGTSMYSFLTYARKVLPPSVVTTFWSEHHEKGTIEWNMMTFEVARQVTQAELEDVQKRIDDIRTSIKLEKAFYANAVTEKEDDSDDDDL